MDRRDFFQWAAGLTLTGTALLTGLTAARAITPPARSIDGKTKMPPTPLVAVAALKPGEPKLFEYGDDNVFIVKSAGDKVVVLNAACPHVQCKLFWDAATKQFACPCHASFFDANGKRISGPASRDMDKAEFTVAAGQVVVSGVLKG
jgi:Rieske Fe-S protein